MKTATVMFSLTGAAIALAIVLTLEMNFHSLFNPSPSEPLQEDIAILNQNNPHLTKGLLSSVSTLFLYLFVMGFGAVLTNITGKIILGVLKRLSGKS